MLGVSTLENRRFLDIGCGSGLSSLAARRLGAVVRSFDYDADSVSATEALRRRYRPSDTLWTIERGSALDDGYLARLGQWDVVYSWGVLHHTGEMERAISLAQSAVAPGGQLFIAIYNDQGGASRRWLRIKRWYQQLPSPLKPLLVGAVAAWFELRYAAARLLHGQNPLPFADWRSKKRERGMSAWVDWVDWVGGYPFEVATPERIIVPLVKSGFVLENLTTCGAGFGCNQFVFRRAA